MTKTEIEKIKKVGIDQELFGAISGRLWDAKTAIEKADVDRCKDFANQIKKVRKAIDDAEQLLEEINKI